MSITLPIRERTKVKLRIKDHGGTSPAPPYTGDYEVDPHFYEQTLSTKNKLMTDNVSVHAIEVQRVSNPQGGLTVYIGGIING